MEEQQVDVVVVTVEGDALLPLDEREAGAELEEEALDFAQQRRLEVLLAVGVAQAEEVEQVGVLEDEVRRDLVGGAERGQLLADERVGLLRERRALVEHAVDLLLQHARAPALDAAHLGVEVALERVLHGDERLEVGPAQLSPQCGDNLGVGERLGELHHAAQVLLAEAPPEARLQLSPQRGDNLGAVLGAPLLQDVRAGCACRSASRASSGPRWRPAPPAAERPR